MCFVKMNSMLYTIKTSMYTQMGFHCFVTVPESSRLPTYALLFFNMHSIHVLFTVPKRTNLVYPDRELIVLSMCLSFPTDTLSLFIWNSEYYTVYRLKRANVYAKMGDSLMGPHVRAYNISYWLFAIFFTWIAYCLQFDKNDCVNLNWDYKYFLHVFLCISKLI